MTGWATPGVCKTFDDRTVGAVMAMTVAGERPPFRKLVGVPVEKSVTGLGLCEELLRQKSLYHFSVA